MYDYYLHLVIIKISFYTYDKFFSTIYLFQNPIKMKEAQTNNYEMLSY